MGKIKLTQEQAEAIERIKDKDYAINVLAAGKRPDNPLCELEISDLAKALYIGYEVEPEFKRGQWIYDITDKNKTVIEVAYVTDKRVHGFWKTQHSDIDTHVAIENARHFTKEEIAKEKERIWWRKHGREPWEIREDDTLTCAGVPYVVDWFNSEVVRFKSGISNAGFCETFDYVKERFEVFCFAEDRKDVEHA